jgi:hypothetical protein
VRIRSAALVLLGVITLFGVAVGSALAQTPADDPQAVAEAFELARGASDVDAALGQFADNAVVTVQGPTTRAYTGKDQVRMYLQTFGVRFQTVMRSTPHVQGNSVSWTERDEFPSQVVDSTVIVIVNAGRISSLIYRNGPPFGSPQAATASAAKDAPAPGQELPSLAWPAALAVVGLGLLAVVFGRPRRKASRSRLDGRLLLALQRPRSDRAA